MTTSRVAFLGLGTMGSGMARNLLKAGVELTVWNRSPAPVAALREAGARAAASPRAAAEQAEVVFCCVASDPALRDVVLDGASAALGGLASGSLLVDCGTTSLPLTEELARRVREAGSGFLDAPVTGSKLGAERGTLTFMVGGSASDLARIQPLLAAMGKHVVLAGERVGLGQSAKYCLNMIQSITLEGLLEGYVLARQLGVPLAKMAEILENSAGRSGVGAFKTPYLLAGDFAPHFRLDLMHKDLHLALGEAASRRVPLPAARTVQTVYDQAVAEGLGAEDFLATARLLERWARRDLRED